MARKVVSRKELRDQHEAAERAGAAAEPEKKKVAKRAPAKRAPAKRAPAKRKSRAKEPVEVRMRVMWGVYSQAMKLVDTFAHDEKKAAEKKASSLSQSGKTPHFVQKIKQPIEEA
jgi:hypothetical protein